MRIPTFTFENEAMWMVLLSVGPAVLAAFILFVVYLLR